MHRCAVKVLQCILVSMVVHGYVGLSKGERLRADRLQAGGGTGACRWTAVVYTVVGLNAGVYWRRGTGEAGFSCTRDPWTTTTVPGVTGPTGLVHQPPLRFGRQHVGRVGLVVGGFIAIDFQASLPHRMQARLLLAAEETQSGPLDAAEQPAAQARTVPRVHERVDARLEEDEHEAAQLKLVVGEAAFRRQNILRQREAHGQTAK